jgi:hypothetical protein
MSVKPIQALAAALLAAATAGCSGYLDHNDTISASAGDAMDANAAIQTIDPWPRSAEETEILSGGKNVSAAKTAAPSADAAPADAAAAGNAPATAATATAGN